MVVPYRHIPLLSEATTGELHEIIELLQYSQRVVGHVYSAQGFNMGMNLGQCAGAGIVDHIHMHILPRWAGDTNFITVVGETRVIPEDLTLTYQKLLPHFSALSAPEKGECEGAP